LRRELIGASLCLAVLYPATARPGLIELHSEVLSQIHRFLGHPELDPRWQHEFLSSCQRLLDDGAWPRKDLGERALAAIGYQPAEAAP